MVDRVKVFLDASVLLAALGSSTGGSARILQLCRLRAIQGVITKTILGETKAHADKVNKTRQDVEELIRKNQIFVLSRPQTRILLEFDGVLEDEDRHVLAGAKIAKVKFLISLDKRHILTVKTKKAMKSIKVLSPKDFLQKYLPKILS